MISLSPTGHTTEAMDWLKWCPKLRCVNREGHNTLSTGWQQNKDEKKTGKVQQGTQTKHKKNRANPHMSTGKNSKGKSKQNVSRESFHNISTFA